VDETEHKEHLQAIELAGNIPNVMTDSTDTISEQSEALLADSPGAVFPIVSYKNATVFKEKERQPEAPDAKTVDKSVVYTTKPEPPVNPAVREIVTNLPKVWKVLTELLSHHSPMDHPGVSEDRPCYKKVDTPNGPTNVISVSNTFIRLKELILEKQSLTRELCRLKHLNTHLETRLDDQEKR